MTRENQIREKILILKGRTLLNSDGKRCRFVDYSYYKKDKIINLRISFGFGASEKIETYEIQEHDLDIKIDGYTFAPKIDNSEIINTEQLTNENITINKPLAMSKHTDDNLKGLRTHLFNAIRNLEGGTMKSEEAKSMAQVAQVIINSAKLEMDFKLLTNDKPNIDLID